MATSTGGTTLTFNSSSLGIVQSIRNNETAAEMDVTDINSDSQWNAYLSELDAIGLDRMLEITQTTYDNK